MKSKLFFTVPLLLAVITGCVKQSTTNVTLPTGKFSGTFTKIHLSSTTGKRDTATASLILTLSATTGFAVTGDTSKVHAGSYGGYSADGTYIEFSDFTLPTSATSVTPTPTKYHLNGIYLYNYSTAALQIYLSNDTVGYTYNLVATP